MPPTISRPIALVGMPGAGKTLMGQLLAERVALPFFDCDGEIERRVGMTIARLFAEHGEAHFRAIERNTLAALLNGAPRIVATGGGAMADPAMRGLLVSLAETIWLDAPPAVLARRLSGDHARPLLIGQELRPALATLARRRRPSYRLARHRIGAEAEPDVVLTRMLNLFEP